MGLYAVTIEYSKVSTYEVNVEAESYESAEEIAFENFAYDLGNGVLVHDHFVDKL